MKSPGQARDARRNQALLLELDHDAGQQVHGVLVRVTLGHPAGLPHPPEVGLDALREQLNVFEVPGGARRVVGKGGRARHLARAAVDDGAQGHRALRHRVVVQGEAGGEGLEQRVQGRRSAAP